MLFQPANMFVAGLLAGAVAYLVNWLVYRGTPTFKAAFIALVVSGACIVVSLVSADGWKDAFLLFGGAWIVIAFAEAAHSIFIASRASAA